MSLKTRSLPGPRSALVVLTATFLMLVMTACGSESTTEPMSGQVTILARARPDDPAAGTFKALGPAVDAGVVCSSGSWANAAFFFGSVDDNWFEDEMTCDDGSGSFVLRVSDLGTPTTDRPWTGPWSVVRGSGDYPDLHGAGSFAADFSSETGSETYIGEVGRG